LSHITRRKLEFPGKVSPKFLEDHVGDHQLMAQQQILKEFRTNTSAADVCGDEY
jgi:hypothetical protein